jgi:hypothetical protein
MVGSFHVASYALVKVGSIMSQAVKLMTTWFPMLNPRAIIVLLL